MDDRDERGSGSADESFDEGAWRRRIETHREEKDDYFRESSSSPIPDDRRGEFEGLSYFPLDPDYRLVGRFHWLGEPEPTSLRANRGPDVEYDRVATVGFTLDGSHHTLAVFRAPSVDDLLVPFRDSTNGRTTWTHGRYLRLDPPAVESGAEIAVDFNLAYHPYPVYDDEFVCALPPDENELPVAIRAGERL